nr:hypothetical protein [Tanacetum cinerariifolium]
MTAGTTMVSGTAKAAAAAKHHRDFAFVPVHSRRPPYTAAPSTPQPPPHPTISTAINCRWDVRRQTTIVVAVERRYSHHSRTLWCRAVMVLPLGVSHSGQPPKTTAVVAAEPVENTTAAPCGVGLVVAIPHLLNYCYIIFP